VPSRVDKRTRRGVSIGREEGPSDVIPSSTSRSLYHTVHRFLVIDVLRHPARLLPS
jgi:hypothetical protein